jgi:hypothetical protein
MKRAWRALFAALTLWLAVAVPAWGQEWTTEPGWDAEARLELPAMPAEWMVERGTYLRVHGARHDSELLLRLARHGSSALPRLADELQVPIGKTIHVVVAGSDTEFRAMQPGDAPTWADATAYPALGTIYLRAPRARAGDPEPLEQVLDHELVHVLLGRAFAPDRPPQWLQEGVAQVLAQQTGPQTTRDIARGMLGGGLIGLEELSWGFPADPLRARLAYAESADFIQYLKVSHGPEVLPRLVHEVARDAEIGAALRRSTGVAMADLEADWRDGFESNWTFSWTALTQSPEWVLGLGGLLLVVGGVMRRRRFHRRLEEMEEEERLVDELLAQLRARSGAADHRTT